MTQRYRILQTMGIFAITFALIACTQFGEMSKGNVQNGIEVGLALKPAEPRSGDNDFKVSLKGPSGSVENAAVTVTYFMPAMGTMAAMKGSAQAKPVGSGEYVAALNLPMEGDWTITVSASLPDGQTITARFQIRTGSSSVQFLGQ